MKKLYWIKTFRFSYVPHWIYKLWPGEKGEVHFGGSDSATHVDEETGEIIFSSGNREEMLEEIRALWPKQ